MRDATGMSAVSHTYNSSASLKSSSVTPASNARRAVSATVASAGTGFLMRVVNARNSGSGNNARRDTILSTPGPPRRALADGVPDDARRLRDGSGGADAADAGRW